MRKDFGVKPYLYPQPVLIISSYDQIGNPNAMNAAWGGIVDSDKIAICLDINHKTTENILKNKEFVVSFGTKKYYKECDYLGSESGKKVTNKIEKCGLHITKSKLINAPIIDELPLSIECKLLSYDLDSELLIAEIINVSCDEEYLTNGKIDPLKIEFISFDPANNKYLVVDKEAGNAFKDGKVFR